MLLGDINRHQEVAAGGRRRSGLTQTDRAHGRDDEQNRPTRPTRVFARYCGRPLEIALAISSRKGIRRAMPVAGGRGQPTSQQPGQWQRERHPPWPVELGYASQSIISATIGHFAVDQASQGFTHRPRATRPPGSSIVTAGTEPPPASGPSGSPSSVSMPKACDQSTPAREASLGAVTQTRALPQQRRPFGNNLDTSLLVAMLIPDAINLCQQGTTMTLPKQAAPDQDAGHTDDDDQQQCEQPPARCRRATRKVPLADECPAAGVRASCCQAPHCAAPAHHAGDRARP